MKKKSILLAAIVLLAVHPALKAGVDDWRELSSRHFDVYFKSGLYSYALKAKNKAENFYFQISDRFGFSDKDPFVQKKLRDSGNIKIYIYASREEYLASTNQPSWSYGCANYSERKISGYRVTKGFLFNILPHELGHIVFRDFIGSGASAPGWVDEGVACLCEPKREWWSKRIIRNAKNQEKIIPFDELTATQIETVKDETYVDVYYAQSINMVEFLLERFGKRKFLDFCVAFRDRLSIEEALKKVYGFNSSADFMRAWESNL